MRQLPSTHPGIKSKNPIAGYMVCTCESVATLHHFRGDDRQGLYSNCPSCGTSVSKAADYQARLKAELVPELDQLPASALTTLSGNEPRTDSGNTSDIEGVIVDTVETNEINEPSGTDTGTSPRTLVATETPEPEVNETAEASGNEPRTVPRIAKYLLGLGLFVIAAAGGRAAYVKMKG